jgi:ferrochelatase
MKIEKLLEIVKAKISNNSQKEEVYNATVISKKVTEDDLFIGSDIDSIKEAIKRGASAVIHDQKELDIKTDTALIKVTSVKEAALKLLSYIVNGDENLYFYLLNPKAITFLKMIQTGRKEVEYLPKDWQKAFEMILNSQKAIFVSSDKEMMQIIKPNIKPLKESAFGYIVEDTLFRSTFRVDKFVYQHKKMIPFHLPHLLKAVHICQKHKLPYSIDKLNYTKHFRPIFIDEESYLQKGEIDDHVVIVTDNLEDINEGREYAKTAKVTMSKSIVFTPPKVKIEAYTKPTVFKDSVSLVSAVKTTSFNFGFVYSDKEEDYLALKEYFDQLRERKI